MKKELKEKWVVALRNGTYKQGRGCLKSRDISGEGVTHCCLGVLCDVIDPNGWSNRNGQNLFTFNNEQEEYGLPEKLKAEIRFPLFLEHDLMNKNDGISGPSYDFLQIAYYIERKLQVEQE